MSGNASSSLAAVVIGIDTYPAPVPNLCCAVNDAEAVSSLLLSRWRNAHVSLLLNEQATFEEIRKCVIDAAARLDENGVLLISFSGHGTPIPIGPIRAIWQAAFLTGDLKSLSEAYQSRFETGFFTVDHIKSWLNEKELAPKNVILILDACGAGASILSSPHKEPVKFDGHAASGRYLNLEGVDLAEIGRFDGPIRIEADQSSTPWPPGTRVVAVTAATGGGAAHEIPALGHGILTLSVLRWMSEVLTEPGTLKNIGGDLFKYVTQYAEKLHLPNTDDDREPLSLQKPDQLVVSTIDLDTAQHLYDRRTTESFETVCRHMPVASRGGDVTVFDANVDRIVKTMNFDDRVKNVGDANFVFQAARFSDMRSMLHCAATKLTALEKHHRPVLFLGTARLGRLMPFIYSKQNAWGFVGGRETDLMADLSIFERAACHDVDALVNWLGDSKACVIAPYRNDDFFDAGMLHFLKRCVHDLRIRLLITLFTDETVPDWLNVAHYRRIQCVPVDRVSFNDEIEQLELSIDGKEFPECFINNTVMKWLGFLKEQSKGDLLKWQANYHRYVLPFHESGNNLRAVMNVVRGVLADLKNQWSDSLFLVQAMSQISLPRSDALVRGLWKILQSKGKVGNAADPSVALDKLTNLRLVRVSENGNASGGDSLHYLIHSTVKLAINEHIQDENIELYEWRRFAADAIRQVAVEREDESWCSRSVFANEAVCLYLSAREYSRACEVLLQNWDDFVDAGYHESLMQWVLKIRNLLSKIQPWDPQYLTSSKLLIQLLVKLQSLYRHRQEWNRIEELDYEIKERARDIQSIPGIDDSQNGDPPLRQAIVKGQQSSDYNIANYYFVRRDFPEALKMYKTCRVAAKRETNIEQECRCLTRIVHSHVLAGQFDKADAHRGKLNKIIEKLDRNDHGAAQRQRRHLRSVDIERCRLAEDGKILYQLASQAFEDNLKFHGHSGGRNRFGLAISSVHLAWACAFRGEFLRAWYHAGQARELLNDRRIPEYWWFSEVERVAAISLSRLWPTRAGRLSFEAWHARSQQLPDAARQVCSRKILDAQRTRLEQLIGLSRIDNPWRAAELLSALGQFIAHADDTTDKGIYYLEQALIAAKHHKHRFLAAYVCEALAELTHDEEARIKYLTDCVTISQKLKIEKATNRREQNLKKYGSPSKT